ncbi:MAG: hypothetical protein QXT64_02620, partial [Desulfurococcaceae archaeon]
EDSRYYCRVVIKKSTRISLLLFTVHVHRLSSTCVVNMIAHIALSTVARFLVDTALTDKKRSEVCLCGLQRVL